MKKLNLLFWGTLILLCGAIEVFAQTDNTSNKDSRTTNLFEYGEPVISSETNFVNLFKNLPLLVSDTKDFKLLSYKFIGNIKSRSDAHKYLNKNDKNKDLILGLNSISSSTEGILFELHVDKANKQTMNAFSAESEEIKKTF